MSAETTAFRVQVRGNHITVTFVGTSFCVDYPKSKKGQAVLPLGFSNQPTRPQPKWRDFLSVGLANERAKKARLGSQGPLVAHSGHATRADECPLLGVKRT